MASPHPWLPSPCNQATIACGWEKPLLPAINSSCSSSTAEGVYVIDADLLKAIPKTPDVWRDTSLINLKGLAFNRIAVTTGRPIFVLERDITNQLWRMVYPIPARAEFRPGSKNPSSSCRPFVSNGFVSDDPKAELETLGLQPPQSELTLAQGTNTVLALQFGKSPTNNDHQLFCRQGRSTDTHRRFKGTG
jgi:hypothetical protein